MTAVRSATAQDLPALAALAARRFVHDPKAAGDMAGIPAPTAEAMLKALFHTQLRYYLQKGDVLATAGNRGFLTMHFSHPSFYPGMVAAIGPALYREMKRLLTKQDIRQMGRNAKQLGNLDDLSWRRRAAKGRYLYIDLIAIDENLRGSGAFRALLTPALRRAVRLHLPILLDTHNPANLPIYEHFGFAVAQCREGGAGVAQYGMVRPCGAPASAL